MEVIRTIETTPGAGECGAVNLRCPLCGHNGVFRAITQDVVWGASGFDGRSITPCWAGVRVCPNSECRAFVFVTMVGTDVQETFPPQLIEFDASNLPLPIKISLVEAISCHAAGCHRAAALMVRRVLEELCQDKKAQGRNLMEKVKSLQQVAILPPALLAAADELRLLGNDAAHVEAKTYDAIESEEIEVALELTKELLKAAYQYNSLLGRMRALKRP